MKQQEMLLLIDRIIERSKTREKGKLTELDIIELKELKKQLSIHGVVKSLPTKEESANEAYRIAAYVGFNYRKVLNDSNRDAYYSGWLDYHEYLTK